MYLGLTHIISCETSTRAPAHQRGCHHHTDCCCAYTQWTKFQQKACLRLVAGRQSTV